MTTSIGFDPGFGSIKTWNGSATVTPAYAFPAVRNNLNISIDGSSDDTALVKWGEGYAYHVGQYATYKGIGGGASFGFDRFLNGDTDIRALFYRAMASHKGRKKNQEPVALWCAMPVESMVDGKDKATASALRSWMLGQHNWTVNGDNYSLDVERVVTIPQPIAALFDYALDSNGKPINNTNGRVFVASLGMNTVEMLALDGNKIIEKHTAGPKQGVRLLIDMIAGQTGDEFAIADAKLRDGTLDRNVLSTAVGKYWAIVRQAFSARWGDDWTRADKVIVAGGGVLVLKDQLSSFFGSKLYVPKDEKHSGPVISIARGVYKRALAAGNGN